MPTNCKYKLRQVLLSQTTCLVTIIKSLSTKTSSLNEVNCFRSFKQENINTLKEKLKTIDFTPVMELQCVNASYNKCMELHMDAYYASCPLQNKIIQNEYGKQSPWITKGLIYSSITKSKLLQLFLRNPTSDNTQNCKKSKAKATYFDEQIKLAKYDMKQIL